MKAGAALALVLIALLPAGCARAAARANAAPPSADLRAGVTRQYLVETTLEPSAAREGSTSLLTIELTTARGDDGQPVLLYRSISMTGSYGSDLSRVLTLAINRTPVAIRVSAAGEATGMVDWKNQRLRLGRSVRAAGEELGIDSERWASLVETSDEAWAVKILVDEVNLIGQMQMPSDKTTIGDVDPVACTVSVKRTVDDQPSPDNLQVRSLSEGVAQISLKDGWVVGYDAKVRYDPAAGETYTQRYKIRLATPPPTTHCPVPTS